MNSPVGAAPSVRGSWASSPVPGDAATQAFNEAVTPHAEAFGMTILGLGGLAFLTGALGRTMSPLAGVTILVPASPWSLRSKSSSAPPFRASSPSSPALS